MSALDLDTRDIRRLVLAPGGHSVSADDCLQVNEESRAWTFVVRPSLLALRVAGLPEDVDAFNLGYAIGVLDEDLRARLQVATLAERTGEAQTVPPNATAAPWILSLSENLFRALLRLPASAELEEIFHLLTLRRVVTGSGPEVALAAEPAPSAGAGLRPTDEALTN